MILMLTNKLSIESKKNAMISCQVLAAKVRWQTPKRFPRHHLTSLVTVTKIGPVRFASAVYNVTVIARSRKFASRCSKIHEITFFNYCNILERTDGC